MGGGDGERGDEEGHEKGAVSDSTGWLRRSSASSARTLSCMEHDEEILYG
jgi:hypothetical protein